jgi:hypothetical protein
LFFQQRLRIVNFILPEDLKRRFQILPQQFDLGWCERPRIFLGSELPTG